MKSKVKPSGKLNNPLSQLINGQTEVEDLLWNWCVLVPGKSFSKHPNMKLFRRQEGAAGFAGCRLPDRFGF